MHARLRKIVRCSVQHSMRLVQFCAPTACGDDEHPRVRQGQEAFLKHDGVCTVAMRQGNRACPCKEGAAAQLVALRSLPPGKFRANELCRLYQARRELVGLLLGLE
jgi:hypothetical protein